MFETLAVFHFPMLLLNVGLLANNDAMLVTATVFQSPMLPYVVAAVVGLVSHRVTAAPMFASVMVVWELTWAGRSISNAKRAKAFDVPKIVLPLLTKASIFDVGATSSVAFLGAQ